MDEPIPSKVEILLKSVELQQRAMALLFSSDAYKDRGDLPAAVTAYEQLIAALGGQLDLALQNNRYYPESPIEIPPIANPLLNAMLTEADVLEALGHLPQAEARREAALQLSETYLGQQGEAEREQQRAASLIAQGRFNQALVALTTARDLFQEREDPLNMGMVTADIAGILEWLGDYERALREADRAARYIEPLLAGRAPTGSDIAASLRGGQLAEAEVRAKLLRIYLALAQIQARVNRYLGHFAEAERRFRQIMPEVPEVARPAIESQLAAIAIESGRYAEGLAAFDRLEPAFRGLLRPKLGALLSFQAEALLGLGRPAEALRAAEAAIRDLASYRDPDSLWKSQWRRARALAALGRPHDALGAYMQFAETVNALRKAPLGYRLDSTYLRDKLPAFAAAIGLACESRDAERACRLMEMVKARALTATLSVPAGDGSPGAGDLDLRVDALSEQLDALEYAAYSSGWTDEIQQRRAALLAERAALLEQIRFSDPRWRSLSEPVPFEFGKVLDLLARRGQAALTLFHSDQGVIAVLLRDGRCSVARTALSTAAAEALAAYQRNLQATSPDPSRFDPAGLGLDAAQLVPAELLGPALQGAGLIVVPHGPLHLVPWAGLTFAGKRLFEYCPVSILPNLTALLAMQTDFAAAPRVALIGGPDYRSLPGLQPLLLAQAELETIQDIYPSPPGPVGELCTGKEATEANFRRLAGHAGAAGNILHVACHGDFVTGEPMNSGLLLADGKADAAEIARTHLRYDEVILSACSTGVRPVEVQGIALTGDDILGLPGAFLEAGTRSVLVSIPRARDDATLSFMTVYHEGRADGKPPMLALQAAQRTMLANSLYPPHLWIGFTVYGCG
jgi:CHAT domain-containing protein